MRHTTKRRWVDCERPLEGLLGDLCVVYYIKMIVNMCVNCFEVIQVAQMPHRHHYSKPSSARGNVNV